MKKKVDAELLYIFDQIIKENNSENEWAKIESDDWIQTDNYEGGYDATESEFCFSYYGEECEFWFQISLQEMQDYILKEKEYIEMVEAR